jgi:hypothetical protein
LDDQGLEFFYKPLIEEVLNSLEGSFPFLSYNFTRSTKIISIVMKKAPHSFRFFSDFITRWLLFPQQVEVVSLHSVDFTSTDLDPHIYTYSQLFFRLPEECQDDFLIERLALFQEEIKFGVESEAESLRIIGVKGIKFEEKIILIQEELSFLIKKFPKFLSIEILQEFQHMLVLSPEIFKKGRSSRLLCRLVVYQYLFRKWLKGSSEWKVKVFKKELSEGRPALGVFVGVGHLNESDVFDEKHLLLAIQHYLPDVKMVEDSYFSSRRGKNPIATFYLEVERELPFSLQDAKLLKRVLVDDLKGRVESLMQPLFMPSNEEELMRNTMVLSSQIKFMRDIPQVIISFQEQKPKELLFLVILVRVKGPENAPVEELLLKLNETLSCSLERCKTVGFLRKKYTKEAANISISLQKEPFFRKDNSIDLYKARQVVVEELYKVLGEFRDYNGGMISKQNELLTAFRGEIGKDVDELLSDNFFFSLTPPSMRAVLDPLTLKILYNLILQAIQQAPYKKERVEIVFKQDSNQLFACITAEDAFLFEEMQRFLENGEYQPTELAFASVVVGSLHFSGFLYRMDDPLKQTEFCENFKRKVTQYTEVQKDRVQPERFSVVREAV